MNKFTGAGPYFFAAALAGFGVIQLVTQDFLTDLLPVAPSLPVRWLLLILTRLFFLVVAMAIFLRIRQQLAAFVVGIVFAVLLLFAHVPKSLGDIHSGNQWAATFETVMLASGAFMIAFFFPTGPATDIRRIRMMYILSVVSRYLFALALCVFAYQHILFFSYIVSLIPSWMPARVFLAYVVIAAYILSAISLVTGWKKGLAAGLLGLMFLLWVLLLHGPRVAGKLNSEPEWASLFVALAVCGIAFSMAGRWLAGTAPVVAMHEVAVPLVD